MEMRDNVDGVNAEIFLIVLILALLYSIGSKLLGKSDEQILKDNDLGLLGLIPTRIASNIWGHVSHARLPEWMRQWVYQSYILMFGCNVDEIPRPLKEFESLNDFFTRRISTTHRPLGQSPLTSPVDGTVLEVGSLHDDDVKSVKGVNYRIQSLIGQDVKDTLSDKKLSYAIIYLGPGDYHGIHSPCDMDIQNVRHYSGHLFGVSPFFSKLISNVLSVNERLVINGQWKYGFFSIVPVGAYNVGSITLEFDPSVKTNQWDKSKDSPAVDYHYQKLHVEKGSLISFFNMGSTVVMLFETPDKWSWLINPHDKVSFGQDLGCLNV